MLVFYLDTNGLLDAKHYGFRKNVCTVDALHNALKFVAESKRRKVLTYLLPLDIKNAFNNFRRTDIFPFYWSSMTNHAT